MDIKKTNGTAGRFAETVRDSQRLVLDHVVGLQERNVRFAQDLVDSSIEELRTQAASNRAVTQELVERAEKQRGAFQTLVQESVGTWMDLLYAPLAYYKQGLRLVEESAPKRVPVAGAKKTGLPIANYDALNVAEISKKIDGLNAAQIRQVRDHEKRNKNRETLIEQFDRKLRATSA